MRRLEDWRPAFVATIEAHRPHLFAWGTHDCAILSADCILAVTGIDPAELFRGQYDSEESAKSVLAEHGLGTPIDAVARIFREIAPSEAVVGDVAVVKTRRGPATAPVMGSELAVYALSGQLGAVSLMDARRAFRVEIP